MAQLHIYKGSYGTIAQAPDDANGLPQVTFQVDEALAQCSPSLQALVTAHNPPIPANEVTTVEADEDVLEAVKAMLARSLQGQWNKGYEQVIATLGQRIAMGGPTVNAVLGLAQAGGATLGDALRAEQQIANQGIERAVAQLTNVAPYWMNVHLKGVFVSRDHEGNLHNSAAHEVHPLPVQEEPIPMVGWEDPDHPRADTRQSAANENMIDGYYDVTAAVPFYLPVEDGGIKAHIARVANRQAFNFGQQSEPEPISEGQPACPTAEKTQAVLDLVMSTPALRQAIVEQPSQVVVDFESRVETSLDLMVESEYDEDYDDDDGYHHLSQSSRPSGG